MKLKNKKAELTTQHLVLIIVLLVSFIIILFLIFRLNLGDATNEEICHNSVVLKSRAGQLAGSLDCRTSYVCISGGGNCESIPSTAKVKINSESEEEIMKTIADKMANCWWVFGEGKVDYVSPSSFKKVACSVCSVVEFDEKIQENEAISYQELYDYLRTHEKTSSQTYLQYLYSTNSLEELKEDFNPENYFSRNLEFDKSYVILTGISKEGYLSPRWKLWDTEGIPHPVVILDKSQQSYSEIGCDDFLTKA